MGKSLLTIEAPSRMKIERWSSMGVRTDPNPTTSQTRLTHLERNIGKKTMTEDQSFEILLEENRAMLRRLASRHDLTRVLEIEIGSRYKDWDTAMAARKYVIEKYGKPDGVLFRVVSKKYSDGDKIVDLAFGLDAVPDANVLTQFEMMLRDAAEKFGGELPGWEIGPT